jgi:hypothetical protein
MEERTRAALADATAHAAGLADALDEALTGSGDDTHLPHEVAGIIDTTMRELHRIRSRAVDESRRRMDAAMARSAALLRNRPRAR